MFVATMSTEHFEFEAYDVTEQLARDRLAEGLDKHADQCNLENNWWEPYHIEVRAIGIGCFRDGRKL